jgi:two-component SAPR family response regulator
MIGLYSGPFLGNEPDEPWSLPTRERLRHRLVRAIGEACRYWQQTEQPERALDLLERALEAENAAETLYRQLMLCYSQLGRNAEAAETFNRCRKTLAGTLKGEPSAETKGLFDKLLQVR